MGVKWGNCQNEWNPWGFMPVSHCLQAQWWGCATEPGTLCHRVKYTPGPEENKGGDPVGAAIPVCLVFGPQTKKISQKISDNVGELQQCVACLELSIIKRNWIWLLNFCLLNLTPHNSCTPHDPKIMQGESRGTHLQLSHIGTI